MEYYDFCMLSQVYSLKSFKTTCTMMNDKFLGFVIFHITFLSIIGTPNGGRTHKFCLERAVTLPICLQVHNILCQPSLSDQCRVLAIPERIELSSLDRQSSIIAIIRWDHKCLSNPSTVIKHEFTSRNTRQCTSKIPYTFQEVSNHSTYLCYPERTVTLILFYRVSLYFFRCIT